MVCEYRSSMLAFVLMLFLGAAPAIVQAQGMGSHEQMHGMQKHGMNMHDDENGMGGCGGMEQGGQFMDGHGLMGRLNKLWQLDLNAEQRSRLNKLQYELRRQHWNLKGRIMDEEAKLYDLYAADRPDPKKIGSVYGSIFDIRRQMIETSIDAMNRGRDILTKEQQAQLQQFQRECTPGGAAPHGMTHQLMSGSSRTK